MPRGVYVLGNNAGRGKDWPDDVVACMKKYMAAGGTYAGLLVKLRNEYGYTTTRNALIGKAHRLGIVSQNKMKNEDAIKDTLERRKQDRRMQPKTRDERTPMKVRKQKPVEMLRDDAKPSGPHPTGHVFRRKRKLEEIKLARKGHIPAIVESSPDTSKPFGELRRGECKWPTSLDASMACGGKATIGPYCDKHAVLAYRIMPTRKRHAVIGKEQDIDRIHRALTDAEADAAVQHFLDAPRAIGIVPDPVVTAFVEQIIAEDEDDDA